MVLFEVRPDVLNVVAAPWQYENFQDEFPRYGVSIALLFLFMHDEWPIVAQAIQHLARFLRVFEGVELRLDIPVSSAGVLTG